MPALAAFLCPALALEQLEGLLYRRPVAAVYSMVFLFGYAVGRAHAEHEVFRGLLDGNYLLVLVDYHAVAHNGGNIPVKIAHIAVSHAAGARVRARAEAHVVAQLPILQIMPRFVAGYCEVRYLVLLQAIVRQRIDRVQVHVGLLVLVRDKRRAEVTAIHRRSLLKLQAIARKVLRVQLKRTRERVGPVAARLARQAVYEVKAHVLEPGLARRVNGYLRLAEVVPPADDLQYVVVCRLHADRQAVHALRAQELELLELRRVGVYLDRYLRVEAHVADAL